MNNNITNESSRITNNNITSRVKQKIIFLGDQHVGKTCIIERFMYDVFSENTHPTVGVDFLAKTLHIDDKNIRLQLWDTAGQERFRSLIPSYLRDATCSVIVFDVTSTFIQINKKEKDSFDNVEIWANEYKENKGNDAPCVLVANKIDLTEQRVVNETEGKQKAQRINMNYYEISAKNGKNVQSMFKSIAMMLQPSENSMANSLIGNFQFDNNSQMIKEKIINKNNEQTIQTTQKQNIKLGENKEKTQQKNDTKKINKDNCC